MKIGSKSNISYSDDEDLASQFVDWTSDAVVELRQIVNDLSEFSPRSSDAVNRIYDLTHNIKGMGASFEFDLMTTVGTSLCGYLKGIKADNPVSVRVLEAHTRTFEVVLQHRITGDGGSQGEALQVRLQAIIQEES
jgi:chemotaxis protein histidine kinase CheA